MKQMVSGITNYLIKEEVISIDEKDIYLFGITLFFKYLLTSSVVILLGIVNNSLKEVLIVMILCLPIRSFAGGIHLKKESLCLLSSVVIIQILVWISKYLPFNLIANILITLVACLLINLIGPVDNKNKPLDDLEKKVFKIKLQRILFIQMIIFFGSIYFRQAELVTLMTLNFCLNVFSMLLGIYFRKRENKFFL